MSGIGGLVAMAESGNPAVLQAAGRLFGFGQAEQQALVSGGMSKWTVLGIGLLAGALVGIYADRKWPSYTAKVWSR